MINSNLISFQIHCYLTSQDSGMVCSGIETSASQKSLCWKEHSAKIHFSLTYLAVCLFVSPSWKEHSCCGYLHALPLAQTQKLWIVITNLHLSVLGWINVKWLTFAARSLDWQQRPSKESPLSSLNLHPISHEGSLSRDCGRKSVFILIVHNDKCQWCPLEVKPQQGQCITSNNRNNQAVVRTRHSDSKSNPFSFLSSANDSYQPSCITISSCCRNAFCCGA